MGHSRPPEPPEEKEEVEQGMMQEIRNQELFQAVLLVLGAALVLMPLVALADQKSEPQPQLQTEKVTGEETAASEAALSKEDFTKMGVSKVDAIFILRGERIPESEPSAGRI